MITIVDYGMGNLGSVLNMFKRIGVKAIISSDIEEITKASKLLLPGVGAFDAAVKRINDGGFRKILDYKALDECVPILGICLGMQLLMNSSEEGELAGLGWIDGSAHRFPKLPGLKVPHMGWNIVLPENESALTSQLPDEARFYFVHSYFVTVENAQNSILKATHGITFDAAIQRNNIYGAQFHPEKSHKFGMQLLKNFSNI
ncbi:MAG: imidazole glycerol phosphate synthase subunit HisH [Gammaproteobacteria bacterium]